MSYIGREPLGGEVILMNSIESQFDGVKTTFNLTRTISGVTSDFYPISSEQLLVSLGGVIQKPDTSGNSGFKINFNQIVFAVPPNAGVSCFVIAYGNVTDVGAPANNTVTTDKLVDGSVTSAKIADGTIVDADVNAAAAIGLSKLATGALPTAITVASANIVDGTIVNADVNASAAIAGTKISPNFGSQNVVTTGTSTAASLIPTGSTAPTNGIYLPAANSVGISTNGSHRVRITSTGDVGIGITAPTQRLAVRGPAAATETLISVGDLNLPRVVVGYTPSGSPSSTDAAAITADNLGAITLSTRSGQTNRIEFRTSDGTGNAIERMRLDSTGRLGINTTSPRETLEVAGNAFATGSIDALSLASFSNLMIAFATRAASIGMPGELLFGVGPAVFSATPVGIGPHDYYPIDLASGSFM